MPPASLTDARNRATYRMRRCTSHPPGRCSMVDISTVRIHSVGAKKGQRWKHLADNFPKTYRSVLAPSWLSSNRAWKPPQGGVIYTVVHGIILDGVHHKRKSQLRGRIKRVRPICPRKIEVPRCTGFRSHRVISEAVVELFATS